MTTTRRAWHEGCIALQLGRPSFRWDWAHGKTASRDFGSWDGTMQAPEGLLINKPLGIRTTKESHSSVSQYLTVSSNRPTASVIPPFFTTCACNAWTLDSRARWPP